MMDEGTFFYRVGTLTMLGLILDKLHVDFPPWWQVFIYIIFLSLIYYYQRYSIARRRFTRTSLAAIRGLYEMARR